MDAATDSPAERAALLAARARAAQPLYYVEDAPEIDDAGYDSALRELKAIEDKDPSLRTPDSPTQRVGGVAAAGFAEVRHLQPMLSLANARDVDELIAWDQRVRRQLQAAGREAATPYVTEPKIDGLAISLVYRTGCSSARDRGDGIIGEDVTANCAPCARCL